jgi:hypothetical protein
MAGSRVTRHGLWVVGVSCSSYHPAAAAGRGDSDTASTFTSTVLEDYGLRRRMRGSASSRPGTLGEEAPEGGLLLVVLRRHEPRRRRLLSRHRPALALAASCLDGL